MVQLACITASCQKIAMLQAGDKEESESLAGFELKISNSVRITLSQLPQ